MYFDDLFAISRWRAWLICAICMGDSGTVARPTVVTGGACTNGGFSQIHFLEPSLVALQGSAFS